MAALADGTACRPWRSVRRKLPSLEDYVFFSVAVGFSMPWTALSSELSFLKTLHGPDFLLHLNLASCAPCLPTLILQLLFDQRLNRRFGTAQATLVRQCCGLTIGTLCCASLPFLPWTEKAVLLAVGALMGAAGSVAFGSSSQLVARYPAHCGQALALGIVAAGPTVLLLQAALHIDAHPSRPQQIAFFLVAALAPLNALAAVLALLCQHWATLQDDKDGRRDGGLKSRGAAGSMRDSIPESILESADVPLLEEESAADREVTLLDLLPVALGNVPPVIQQSAEAMLLLPDQHDHANADGVGADDITVRSVAITVPTIPLSVIKGGAASIIDFAAQCGFWDAARAVAPLAISLGSSVGVTVMLFPLFTVVPSSGLLGSMLPQALFAACMLPDILGRIIARRGLPSVFAVQVLAAFKFASLALALSYLWFPPRMLSDAAVIAFVGVHWLLNGLIGAWTYMLLPQAVPDPQVAAVGGAIMSTAFQGFSIVGLAAALLLETFCHPSASSWGPAADTAAVTGTARCLMPMPVGCAVL
eukprot:jgi/Ulvmu1/8643/UM046_0048.1